MISKIELNDIPGRKAAINNLVSAEVTQFHESDWPACEVDTKHYKNIHSATAAYREAIKRLKIGVVAIERGGRLFLIRANT